MKRGVNEKGRVANDVETEQIVFQDTPDDIPSQITSVVQHRGSIFQNCGRRFSSPQHFFEGMRAKLTCMSASVIPC